MDSATRQQLWQRIGAALQAGRPEMADAVASSPVARYTDPARFRAEVALFRRFPQVIAAAGEIAEPGSWLARDLSGVPVLLARDSAGNLRAFLNVCRHRGARVMPAGSGRGQRFACPYHAWTYGPDGALLGRPQEFGFPGLDRAACGLQPLALAERAGLVFVTTDPAQGGNDLSPALDPLAAELEGLGFASHVPYSPRRIEVACNWKLVLDASFEGYHFKVAHRATIAHMFADNQQIVDEFGLNRRLFLVRGHVAEKLAQPDATLDPRQDGNIIYFFFPNTLILVQHDHAQVTRIEPLGPDRTAIHDIALIPEAPATEKAAIHWDRNMDLYRRTLGEDYALMESMQSTLRTGANEALTFGRFEFAADRFHRQLETELAAAG